MYGKEMPFVYRLSFRRRPLALVMHIHPECSVRVSALFAKKTPLIAGLENEFPKFGEFGTDLAGNFGFPGACRNEGIKDGLLTFAFPVPSCISFDRKKKCSWCNGTGKSEFGSGQCFGCRTTGREKISHVSRLWKMTVTLHVMFKCLWYFSFDEENSLSDLGKGHQLAFLETINDPHADMHGGSLGGWCHDLFVGYVARLKRGSREYSAVQKTMCEVYMHTENFRATPKFGVLQREDDFRFFLNGEGGFHIAVPGINDCCISNMGIHEDKNEFSCHNVDTQYQQLYLLTGFAALWDMAAKSINK